MQDKRPRVSHAEGELSQRTRTLLRETAVPYLEIFKATNISPNWLSLFVNGKIPDPGVNRVECLYNFLAKRTLATDLHTADLARIDKPWQLPAPVGELERQQ